MLMVHFRIVQLRLTLVPLASLATRSSTPSVALLKPFDPFSNLLSFLDTLSTIFYTFGPSGIDQSEQPFRSPPRSRFVTLARSIIQRTCYISGRMISGENMRYLVLTPRFSQPSVCIAWKNHQSRPHESEAWGCDCWWFGNDDLKSAG